MSLVRKTNNLLGKVKRGLARAAPVIAEVRQGIQTAAPLVAALPIPGAAAVAGGLVGAANVADRLAQAAQK